MQLSLPTRVRAVGPPKCALRRGQGGYGFKAKYHSAPIVEPPPPPTTTVGSGVYLSRPPETQEPGFITAFGRFPDVNSDSCHGGNGAGGTNGNWQFALDPNSLNGSWDNWGVWLNSHPTRRLEISLGMCPWEGPFDRNTAGNLLDQVALGTHNAKFTQWANIMLGFGLGGSATRSVYLRLGWEMGGSWFPWGANFDTPGQQGYNNFAEAWREIHTTLKAANPHWKFAFCANDNDFRNNGTHGHPDYLAWLDHVYPGNAFVDFIGFDIYDRNTGFYPPQNTTTWTNSWNQFHLPHLTRMEQFAQSKGKRMMIGEFNTIAFNANEPNNTGGLDDPIFFQNLYDWIVARDFEFVNLFNRDNVGGDWHRLEVHFPNAYQKYLDTFCTLPHPW